jgi:hypothetical protein
MATAHAGRSTIKAAAAVETMIATAVPSATATVAAAAVTATLR